MGATGEGKACAVNQRARHHDAYQRDWEVIVAADCVGSYDLGHHEISLRYMKGKIALVMSNEDIRGMLDAPK
jgi:isochorismate hydrolase